MQINNHIQQETDKTMSLLEHPAKHTAPADFLSNLDARMEREELANSRFYRSTLLKVAAVVAFIAMNAYTWFHSVKSEQVHSTSYAESVFETYTTTWSNALNYE